MANTYRGSLDGNSQGIQLTLPVASGVTVTEVISFTLLLVASQVLPLLVLV